jgi:predicted HAD superfamily Cof-like phosphohydrolase
MTTMRDRTLEFHRAFDCAMASSPESPRKALLEDRLAFTAEEFFELLAASGCPFRALEVARAAVGVCVKMARYDKFDLPDFVDAHADLMYFLSGTMVAIGVDEEPIHAEVHRANMAKLWLDGKPRHRASDGKVVKPPGWSAPDIDGELRKQGWKGQ